MLWGSPAAQCPHARPQPKGWRGQTAGRQSARLPPRPERWRLHLPAPAARPAPCACPHRQYRGGRRHKRLRHIHAHGSRHPPAQAAPRPRHRVLPSASELSAPLLPGGAPARTRPALCCVPLKKSGFYQHQSSRYGGGPTTTAHGLGHLSMSTVLFHHSPSLSCKTP